MFLVAGCAQPGEDWSVPAPKTGQPDLFVPDDRLCDAVTQCAGDADCDPCNVTGTPCEGVFACEAGRCRQGPPLADCAANPPCAKAETPGCADEAITLCVCQQDAYCCSERWDRFCVDKASACGACALFPSEDPCFVSACSSDTGQCEPTEKHCDDGEPCTADRCDAGTGQCTWEPIADCGKNHPCRAAVSPGSSSDSVSACVCAMDDYCCTSQWDELCVLKAQSGCGLECDCASFDAEALACSAFADCAFCDPDADLCTGGWQCEAGTCVATAPVACVSGRLEEGCLRVACNPATGLCEPTPDDAACADQNPCTIDTCWAGTGECHNLPNPDCDPALATCQGRCDGYSEDAPCQCDALCFEFADCCPDLCERCLEWFPDECM